MVLKAKEVRDEMRQEDIPVFSMRHRMALSLEYGEISVNEMAGRLQVSRTTVSNYLHGRTSPRYPDLVVWSMVTGVPLDWLIEGVVPDITPDTKPKRGRKQANKPSACNASLAAHAPCDNVQPVDNDTNVGVA